jgi:hypothetical protein
VIDAIDAIEDAVVYKDEHADKYAGVTSPGDENAVEY